MPKYRVMVAEFPGDQRTLHQTALWVTKTYRMLGQQDDILDVIPWAKSDTPITMVRNGCIKDALTARCDYVLMVDNDTVPDFHVAGPYRLPNQAEFWPSSWAWLMKHRDRPGMIAAPYVGPPPIENIYAFQWVQDQSKNPNDQFALRQFSREEAMKLGGVQEVGALATGCIIIDMRIFASLPPPWFDYEFDDPPFNSKKSTTEDCYFTRNASLLGFSCWVNWDSWASHWKPKYCGKPEYFGINQIHNTLVAAVKRGHSTADILINVEGRRPMAPPLCKATLDRAGIGSDEFLRMSVTEQAKTREALAFGEPDEQPVENGDGEAAS